MKAIIDVRPQGDFFRAAKAALRKPSQDLTLSFESAKAMYSDLSPARLELLHTLSGTGPCSVNALAQAAQRNYSNVHTDVARLEQLGLIERTADGAVFVPFSQIDIRVALAQAA